MKMIEETSLLQNRRRVLSAVIMSPLLLYSFLHGGKSRTPATTPADSDEFVVVNGWVMLKQDIAEYQESFS